MYCIKTSKRKMVRRVGKKPYKRGKKRQGGGF